jgi:regulator of protease activity HflC (stomatin/prohibitin superfamily)
MGFLANWGIQKLENAGNDLRRIGQALGFMPLCWRDVVTMNPSRNGVMWRIPDPQVPSAASLIGVRAIFVVENELVMVMRDGKLGEQIILPPGLYDIRQLTALRGRIEVLWFTTTGFQIRWGNGDVMTRDNESVGAFGTYRVKVVDPLRFFYGLVGNKQVYTENDLSEDTKPTVRSTISGVFRSKDISDLQAEQPAIQLACKEKLMQDFADWGIEFLGLAIEKINFPEGYLEAARGGNRVSLAKQAQIKGAEADITLAMLEAQKEQYRILTEASRERAIGNVRVEIMQNQLNAGIDPLELQKIEAIKLLAEHPAEGTLVDNRPQIVNQLLPQPPLMPPAGPVIVTGNPFVPSVPQYNQASSLPANAPAPVSSNAGGSGEAMTREKIEEMLDKLDERFANGEISEQVYLTLQAKWNNRLEKLS